MILNLSSRVQSRYLTSEHDKFYMSASSCIILYVFWLFAGNGFRLDLISFLAKNIAQVFNRPIFLKGSEFVQSSHRFKFLKKTMDFKDHLTFIKLCCFSSIRRRQVRKEFLFELIQ